MLIKIINVYRGWLEEHREIALENQEACKPIRIEVERLKAVLCNELELKDIKWDSGWNISHFRGALQSFQALLKDHPSAAFSLKGQFLFIQIQLCHCLSFAIYFVQTSCFS